MSYAKFDIVKDLFDKAFNTNEESNNIVIELLRHKVPIHVGGLADPFQSVEWRLKLKYELIKLSNEYDYPLIFSTKTAHLPQEYWEILNPRIHTFQISLIGLSDEYIRKYEQNTPLASERLEFLKELRAKGFWCSIRIQPIIDMQEVIKLCEQIDGVASYITVEHLKINIENPVAMDLFKDIIPKFKARSKVRDLEMPYMEKIDNITEIKKHIHKTKVGVGDNDLHWLSDSRCCCGVDTMGKEFENYLKYNLTYFTTEKLGKKIADDETIWLPQGSVRNSVNGDIRVRNVSNFKDYVDMYCSKFNDFMCDGCSMKSKTNGIIYNQSSGEKMRQISLFNIDETDD